MPQLPTLGVWRAVCTQIRTHSPLYNDKWLLAIPSSYIQVSEYNSNRDSFYKFYANLNNSLLLSNNFIKL